MNGREGLLKGMKRIHTHTGVWAAPRSKTATWLVEVILLEGRRRGDRMWSWAAVHTVVSKKAGRGPGIWGMIGSKP